MIPEIVRKFRLDDTKENREVMKKILKVFAGVDSLASLDNSGKSRFIESTAVLLAGEAAIVFDLPGEIGTEEKDMRDFLKGIYK